MLEFEDTSTQNEVAIGQAETEKAQTDLCSNCTKNLMAQKEDKAAFENQQNDASPRNQ